MTGPENEQGPLERLSRRDWIGVAKRTARESKEG